MNDDIHQSKRQPWTRDPNVLKEIWGEGVQIPSKIETASLKVVAPKGSIWPTQQELNAITNNAMPDIQTFTYEPILKSEPVIKPSQHTSMIKIIDGPQQLIDNILVRKEYKEDDEEDYDIDEQFGIEDDEEDETETKEKISSKKRQKLSDSDFVLPNERKFPVISAKGVMDAVNSWGRYKGNASFETFKENLIALAKRKGYANALPEKWTNAKSKSFEHQIIVNIETTDIAQRMKSAQEKMQSIIDKHKA